MPMIQTAWRLSREWSRQRGASVSLVGVNKIRPGGGLASFLISKTAVGVYYSRGGGHSLCIAQDCSLKDDLMLHSWRMESEVFF